MKLVSAPLSLFGAKAQIALAEKQLEFSLDMAPFSLDAGYQPRHPLVLAANPKEQVPILVDGDLTIIDSTQIFEYLEDRHPAPPLWPVDARRRAAARQAEMWADEVAFPRVAELLRRRPPVTGQDRSDLKLALRAEFLRLEARGPEHGALLGVFGYADIAWYMVQLFADLAGAPLADDMPRLIAWRDAVSRRPAVRGVIGPMAEYVRSIGLRAPATFAALG